MARLSIKWSEIRLIILSANLMTTPFIRCFINQKEERITLPEYLEEFSEEFLEEFSEEELHEEEEQHHEEEEEERVLEGSLEWNSNGLEIANYLVLQPRR